jgi:Gram-negative bacterial TonB protein C-terminal
MFVKWIASIGLAAALCCTSAQAQAPASVLHLDFKADVQADGVPTNIQPDASLAPPLQAMVRKRVAEWRYRLGMWQGTPVPGPVSQRIVAEALPVASGGFALRIREITYPTVMVDRKGAHEAGIRIPPMYPKELMRQGVSAVLVYAYRVDAAGKARDIELAHPVERDRAFRLLDEASREAIGKWVLPPTTVAGEPVDCRVTTPITFRIGDDPLPKAPDLAAYRASHPDMCPSGPVLLTKVEGSML